MNRGTFLTRLLLALALLGLVVAPVQNASAARAASMMQALSARMDMSCCPDGMPIMADCGKDCPAALVCGSSVLNLVAPEVDRLTAQLYHDVRFSFGSDPEPVSKAGEPPPRPPRA